MSGQLICQFLGQKSLCYECSYFQDPLPLSALIHLVWPFASVLASCSREEFRSRILSSSLRVQSHGLRDPNNFALYPWWISQLAQFIVRWVSYSNYLEMQVGPWSISRSLCAPVWVLPWSHFLCQTHLTGSTFPRSHIQANWGSQNFRTDLLFWSQFG